MSTVAAAHPPARDPALDSWLAPRPGSIPPPAPCDVCHSRPHEFVERLLSRHGACVAETYLCLECAMERGYPGARLKRPLWY